MTITCASGSSAGSGSPAFFTFTQADIAAFAPPIFGFVTYALMGIPTTPQQTATFCATPPVGALPIPQDYIDLAFPPIAFLTGAYGRFGEQVKEDKWAELCVCNGAPPPTTPCTLYTGTFFHTNCSAGVCFSGSNCCYQTPPFDSAPHGGTGLITFPSGQHRLIMTIPGAPAFDGQFEAYTTAHGETTGYCHLNFHPGIPNPTVTCDFATSDTWVQFVWFQTGAGTISVDMPIEVGFAPVPGVEAACTSYAPTPPPALVPPTGYPPQPPAPTCGTSQDICNLLTQIDNRTQQMYMLETIEQRRLLPFAWIAQTPNTGLTGHGTITVQDIIGVTVSVTARTAGWGSTADTPQRFIPTFGAIQASDGTVVDDWRQIHYLQEIFSIPSWATQVSYSLRSGVTATITPLKPEP